MKPRIQCTLLFVYLSAMQYVNYLRKLCLVVYAGPDGVHEGDWICPKCENVNFAFRTTCNIKKCGAPRPSAVSDFFLDIFSVWYSDVHPFFI